VRFLTEHHAMKAY